MLHQDDYPFMVYLLLINILTAQGQLRSSASFPLTTPTIIGVMSYGLNGELPHSE